MKRPSVSTTATVLGLALATAGCDSRDPRQMVVPDDAGNFPTVPQLPSNPIGILSVSLDDPHTAKYMRDVREHAQTNLGCVLELNEDFAAFYREHVLPEVESNLGGKMNPDELFAATRSVTNDLGSQNEWLEVTVDSIMNATFDELTDFLFTRARGRESQGGLRDFTPEECQRLSSQADAMFEINLSPGEASEPVHFTIRDNVNPGDDI